MKEFGQYAGLGLRLAAALCIFAAAGYWLDKRLGTLPLFLIVGVALGAVGGTLSILADVPGARRRRGGPPRGEG